MAQSELYKNIQANDEKIKEIAESAKAIALKHSISADELFEYIIAGVKNETRFMQWAIQFTENWPSARDEAYQAHADVIGGFPLTEDEKKQAWLDYVLKEMR